MSLWPRLPLLLPQLLQDIIHSRILLRIVDRSRKRTDITIARGVLPLAEAASQLLAKDDMAAVRSAQAPALLPGWHVHQQHSRAVTSPLQLRRPPPPPSPRGGGQLGGCNTCALRAACAAHAGHSTGCWHLLQLEQQV